MSSKSKRRFHVNVVQEGLWVWSVQRPAVVGRSSVATKCTVSIEMLFPQSTSLKSCGNVPLTALFHRSTCLNFSVWSWYNSLPVLEFMPEFQCLKLVQLAACLRVHAWISVSEVGTTRCLSEDNSLPVWEFKVILSLYICYCHRSLPQFKFNEPSTKDPNVNEPQCLLGFKSQ